MNKIIEKLPFDVIINHIIPYTYSIQSKNLICDIKSYFLSKTQVRTIYYGLWFDDVDEASDKEWLINDLFAFANDYNPTIFGYVDSFYEIFSRHVILKNDKLKINEFIIRLENEKVDKQINIFLGLLTPEERDDFIDIANMKIRIIN
jgi:hypothetical protein